MVERKIIDLYGVRKRKGEIGIEIEVEGENLPTVGLPDKWNVTNDGSLRGGGFEYVLRNPCTRGGVKKALNDLKICFARVETEVYDSQRAGVHIHINCQEFSIRQMFSFICLYIVFEKLLINYCGETRKGNLFCLSSEDAEALIIQLIQDARSMTVSGVVNDDFRYAAMNLAALGKFGSVEFRSLQTPVDILDIERWVNILLCIKDKALEIEYPREIVEGMSMDGPEQYMEAVFGPLTQYLNCREAEKWITEGARRVQFLAYEATNTFERNKKKRRSRSKRVSDYEIWEGLRGGVEPDDGQLIDMGGTYYYWNEGECNSWRMKLPTPSREIRRRGGLVLRGYRTMKYGRDLEGE